MINLMNSMTEKELAILRGAVGYVASEGGYFPGHGLIMLTAKLWDLAQGLEQERNLTKNQASSLLQKRDQTISQLTEVLEEITDLQRLVTEREREYKAKFGGSDEIRDLEQELLECRLDALNDSLGLMDAITELQEKAKTTTDLLQFILCLTCSVDDCEKRMTPQTLYLIDMQTGEDVNLEDWLQEQVDQQSETSYHLNVDETVTSCDACPYKLTCDISEYDFWGVDIPEVDNECS